MEKEIITVADIQAMYGVSYNKACMYIAGIKSISDTLNVKGVKGRGKVHRQDYEAWLAYCRGEKK